jgi:hypothetical protein|tara:strand:- start:112 stop:366 length:255 start_codon:yes stop_codon:yes gene_type:complete
MSIAVKIHGLENATTFKEIFDVYVEALSAPKYNDEGYLNLNYEKSLAKDSLDTLAKFLDNSPLSVNQWGEMDRMKHEVYDGNDL